MTREETQQAAKVATNRYLKRWTERGDDGKLKVYYFWSRAGLKQMERRHKATIGELFQEVGGVTDADKEGRKYAFKDNGSKVLFVAHCDVRDCGSDHFFYHNYRAWSSRLDDRLGVHIGLDLLPELGINVDWLLTEGEEEGKSTAEYFKTEKQYNWMVEFDRRGEDAVHYKFHDIKEKIKPYFKDVQYGGNTDITELGHLNCCGFNVGIGYHGEHTLGSYANLVTTLNQVLRFKSFHTDYADVHIPFKDYTFANNYHGGGSRGRGGMGQGAYDDWNHSHPYSRLFPRDEYEYDWKTRTYVKKKLAQAGRGSLVDDWPAKREGGGVGVVGGAGGEIKPLTTQNDDAYLDWLLEQHEIELTQGDRAKIEAYRRVIATREQLLEQWSPSASIVGPASRPPIKEDGPKEQRQLIPMCKLDSNKAGSSGSPPAQPVIRGFAPSNIQERIQEQMRHTTGFGMDDEYEI